MAKRKRLPQSYEELTPAQRRRLARLVKKFDKAMEPHRRAIRESQRLTAADWTLRINK